MTKRQCSSQKRHTLAFFLLKLIIMIDNLLLVSTVNNGMSSSYIHDYQNQPPVENLELFYIRELQLSSVTFKDSTSGRNDVVA